MTWTLLDAAAEVLEVAALNVEDRTDDEQSAMYRVAEEIDACLLRPVPDGFATWTALVEGTREEPDLGTL